MFRLCLDYGHGGRDPGAIYKSRKEKDDVLKLGKRVASILRSYDIKIDETRTSDKTVSLKERSDFERKKNHDYFISFHRNAFKPEQANGVETYTYINQSEKGKDMAEKIQKSLVDIGFRNRGVKKANFHVLRETKSAAILIEIGFVDNTKDNQLFDNKFDEMANSISEAILSQLGIKIKDSNSQSKDKTLYRVMAGSYENRDNAERQIKKLKKAGFDAVIMLK